MKVIDADSHVREPEAMFADLPADLHSRRPIRVSIPTDTTLGDFNCCWIIEGKTYPNTGWRGHTLLAVPGAQVLRNSKVPIGSQTLEDMDARLADLDRLGIDVQIIFPTMFLASVAENVKLETALFQAYNSYVSRACARSKGRVRWVALVPFRDPDTAIAEMRRAKGMGTVGIFTMGMVWDKTLTDPAFFPIYEEAAALDLPICVHQGWGSPQVTALFSDTNAFLCSAIIPVFWGFTYVMATGLLTRFPKLRVAFIETGAAWVPYVIQQLRRHVGAFNTGIDSKHYRDPQEFFQSGRAFVNCDSDEDMRYLLEHVGEDGLMCASDFPHGDPAADENYVSRWRDRKDLPDNVKRKLLGENASRFFAL